jgi:hypothetical protein
MFADPIPNITYDSVAKTLARISSVGQKSIYQTSDGSLVATVSHQKSGSGKIRSVFRLDRNVDVNSDLVLETQSCYVVVERPFTGFSETDTINIVTCLCNALTASTNAGIKKLYAQES